MYTLQVHHSHNIALESEPLASVHALLRARTNLLRLTTTGTPLIHHTSIARISTNIDQSSSVPIVGVDTSQLTAILGSHTLNVDVTLALRAAVSTRAIELAVVLDIETESS